MYLLYWSLYIFNTIGVDLSLLVMVTIWSFWIVERTVIGRLSIQAKDHLEKLSQLFVTKVMGNSSSVDPHCSIATHANKHLVSQDNHLDLY